MNQPKVIYKRSNTGAVLEWHQEVNETGDGFRTVAGQQGGKKVESQWTICTPKNVGRSNETTPQQQCQSEVEANYTKKLAQGGYHDRIEDIDKPKYVKPMLAESYGTKPKKVVTGTAFKAGIVWSQPKLDGMRCTVDSSGMMSRYGKPILSAPHIYEALQPLFETYPDLHLDGELYGEALADDFQKIISLARKGKNMTEAQLQDSRRYLQYHIYDVISVNGVFSKRHEFLKNLFETEIALNTPGSFFRMVPTEQVSDIDHLDQLNIDYVEQHLEGQMVRLDTEPYEIGKRSWQLQKRKIFRTDEFTTIGIEPGVGNRSKIAAKVHFRMPNGIESSSSIRGNWSYCKEILEEADQYIGGDCTIRYIRLTKDGKPYPAVCIALFKGKRDL